MRKLTISLLEFKKNSAKDFAKIIFSALFAWQKICIYAKELKDSNFSEVECELEDKIKKGYIKDLEKIRMGIPKPPWEFCCHDYDGVKDFFIYLDKSGQIGHVTWIYYKGDPNRTIKLKSHEAELKYSLTIKKYRGQRLYPATLIKIQKFLKKKAFERVFICIIEKNLASRKGAERAGFELKTMILLVKILGLRVTKRYETKK